MCLCVYIHICAKGEKQRMQWLDSITDSKDLSLSNLQEIVKDMDCMLQFMGSHEKQLVGKVGKTYLFFKASNDEHALYFKVVR